jgi:flagellin-like protein
MKMKRKAEMGIGTLVLFIALVLVAAITGVVLLQTSGGLQEKTLSTGDQTRGQIATHLSILDVIATDGRERSLDDFIGTMKLSAGSEAIKLEDTVMTVTVKNVTSTLLYAGTSSTIMNNASGYYTLRYGANENITGGPDSWGELSYDYDLDQGTEVLSGGNDLANVTLTLSSGDTLNIGYCNTSEFFSNLIGNPYVSYCNATCGTGATENDTTSVYLERNDSSITLGSGYFAIQYLQESTTHIPGMIHKGDIVRIFFETPRSVQEDEKIIMTFIPKSGTPTILKMTTPEVISRETIQLFP